MIPPKFSDLLEAQERPVVLLEGTRALRDEADARVSAFAAQLARRFPRAVFRSGNAPGSDQAFARGVAMVDVSRLEIVLPYERHRLSERPEGARVLALESIEDHRELSKLTLVASPIYERLFASSAINASAAKLRYLLRDTLKIVGDEAAGFAPATAGLFWINPAKPDTGGTAHTIRVCRKWDVPVWTQSQWESWFYEQALAA